MCQVRSTDARDGRNVLLKIQKVGEVGERSTAYGNFRRDGVVKECNRAGSKDRPDDEGRQSSCSVKPEE